MNTSLRRLDNEQRFKLVEWFARGYTARYIRERLLEETGIDLSDAEVLQGAVLYAEDVTKYRKEINTATMQVGLARKEERVRRLGELAEAYEKPAQANPKAASVYLKTLHQIAEEVEPLKLHVEIDVEDPWYKLLTSLQPSKRQDQTLLPSSTSSEPSG
jgi:hypothetical protein